MYNEFFGLSEAPFSITPDPHFLFMSDRHREAYAHLLYGFGESGGFVQLTGEVGTGKTTLCRSVLEQLPVNVDVAFILNPRLTDVELLANICDELHISYPEGALSLKVMVDTLHRYLLDAQARGRRTVVIIDEAQNLSVDVLEQIRLLTNLETTTQKLLQVILIGQPELIKLLDRQELRQLAQRITARYHLLPFTAKETRDYIAHRLDIAGGPTNLFNRAAVAEVFRYSRGLPRLINVICDRALLGAYVQGQRKVNAPTVRQAIREVTGRDVPRRMPRLAIIAMVSAGIMGALSLGYWLRGRQQPDALANRDMNRAAPGEGNAPLPTTAATPSAGTDFSAAAIESRPGSGVPLSSTGTAGTTPTTPPQDNSNAASTTGVVPAEATRPPVAPSPTAVPAATPATPTATPSSTPVADTSSRKLSELLADSKVSSDADTAFVDLFALWGVSDPKFASYALGCADARLVGLHCAASSGSWQDLRKMDYPVILELPSASEAKYYGVLVGLDDTGAVLSFGGQHYRFSQSEVENFWRGQYIVLRPPVVHSGESVLITPGMRVREIMWVRRRLSAWEGKTPGIAESSDYYDPELKAKVLEFQATHKLKPDGLISHRTLRSISAGPAGPVTPTLSGRKVEANPQP